MTIKKIILLLLPSILLFSCSEKQQDSGGLKADISKLTKDFDKVVINMRGNEILGDSIKTSDTVDAKDGKFEYHFKVKEAKLTDFSLLKNNKKVGSIGFINKFQQKSTWGEIYLGNEKVIINVDSVYQTKEYNGIKSYKVNFEGSNEADMFMKSQLRRVISTENIKANPDCYTLLYKLYDIKEQCSLKQLKEFSSLFSDKLKKAVSYSILQNYINKTEIGYGKNFSWVDVNNKRFNFEQAKNGKQMMLLVFWASWCHPCREEIPQLKKFYSEYKDKVSIVSLSIDDDFDHWKTAVEKENMPWLNLSGLPKNKIGIKREYSISIVPTLILLDSNGKILINVINDLPEIIKIIDRK
jgi:thiol-disulfide isomerase/thioredoxin